MGSAGCCAGVVSPGEGRERGHFDRLADGSAVVGRDSSGSNSSNCPSPSSPTRSATTTRPPPGSARRPAEHGADTPQGITQGHQRAGFLGEPTTVEMKRGCRTSYTITPRAVWHEGVEHGQQLWRFNRARQRVQIRPCDPDMRVQVDLLVGEQTGPHEGWLLVGKLSDEEILRPDVPLAVPLHITVDEHRPVKDGSRVESGFLGQFTSCRHQRRLARLDAATGRLPEACPVERIPPVQKKQAVGSVQADDPGGGPVRCFHRPDAMRCSKWRSRPVLIDISSTAYQGLQRVIGGMQDGLPRGTGDS